MTFTLDTFVFLTITIFIFYIIRRRTRAYFLLAASLFFIARLDIRSCIWVVSVSFAVYVAGLIEELFKKCGRPVALKVTETVSIIVCVASLFVLKQIAVWNFTDNIFSGIILPIGFSYYVFQAISYIVDVKNDKLEAEGNILFFLLYMCYFPKFISGPIERPVNMLEQIKKVYKTNLFENKRISIAFPTILYGFFLKVVIADRLALYTGKILQYPHIYGIQWLSAGMIMYTMQIYCDFAGYSAIAVGVSRLFGIELTENFFAPYLSTDISTFWRRWHVSLSNWLRDYIYIPLGGNRKGMIRKCINIMVVFIVCGLWHGAGISFIIWGFLHGLYSIIHNIVSGKIRPKAGIVTKVIGIVVTFFAVSVAWVFFGAPSTKFALSFLTRMFTVGTGEIPLPTQTLELGIQPFDRVLPLYGLIVLELDILMVKTGLPFGQAVHKLPAVARYIIEYLLLMGLLLFGVYGPGYSAESFMYMNF